MIIGSENERENIIGMEVKLEFADAVTEESIVLLRQNSNTIGANKETDVSNENKYYFVRIPTSCKECT